MVRGRISLQDVHGYPTERKHAANPHEHESLQSCWCFQGTGKYGSQGSISPRSRAKIEPYNYLKHPETTHRSSFGGHKNPSTGRTGRTRPEEICLPRAGCFVHPRGRSKLWPRCLLPHSSRNRESQKHRFFGASVAIPMLKLRRVNLSKF